MKYKLIINFKTYSQATGKKALGIINACKEVEKEAKQRNVEIVVCPQYFDLKDSIHEKIITYSQHLDNITQGAHTGHIVPENLASIGVRGTLISHSEHKLSLKDIEERLKLSKDAGLETCVCARNASVAKKVAKYGPDFIAVEPKELIGGDISISKAKPSLIKKSVEAAGNIPLLVGAGVKNGGDVKIAIELGAKGILVASGVVKAKNIEKELLELLSGFPEK